jgi:hypothetical protein
MREQVRGLNRSNNDERKGVARPALPKVSRLDIEAWHTTLRNGGLAARTIGHAHRVLGTLGARIFSQSQCFQRISRAVAVNQRRKQKALRHALAAVRRKSRADTAVIA